MNFRRLVARIPDPDLAIAGLAFVLGVLVSHPPAVLALSRLPHFAGWADQGQYLRSADAFAHGNLQPSAHWYPLLYPLALALFAWTPMLIATTIVDLACYCACFAGYRAVFRRLGLSRAGVVITFLLGTIAYPVTGDGWLMPWTTTLSAALVWGAFGLVARLMDPTVRGASPWLLGVVLGLIPLCRPADVAVGAAIFLIAVPSFVAARDWLALGATVAAGLATVGAGGLLHLAIYGLQLSDYMLMSSDYGANFAWLGWKAALILLDPRPWYPYGYGVLKIMPWLPIGVAGMVIGAIEPRRRNLTLLLLVPGTIGTAIMLAYVDFLPSGLWKYGNSHYFKWIVPMLAGFTWLYCRDFYRHRVMSLVVLLVVLIPTAIRIVPVAAGPANPARMIVFAPVKAPSEGVYFSHTLISDGLGTLASHYQFRTIAAAPDGPVIAEALHRDFAGDERWIYPPKVDLWRKEGAHDDGPVMPPPFVMQPIARYRPAIGFGWPCWLPPYACVTTLPMPGTPGATARN